ncbi:MAG: fused MFS/spermidine synthase [Gammaproteobacteria bacterium]|nr:fused MFS/spermidine synthase [Gammaproteobacteria bacterium]
MEQPVSVLTSGGRSRLPLYALTIFLSSAGLMALEIAAARLLAPYIGVSLYSWTAIIGVILGGLSLGNWIGGVWADMDADERGVGWTLAVGGLACIGILLMLTLVAPVLQASELGLLTVSFIFVAALFFIPAVLLGIVTPVLTTLALRLDGRTGHVVGMMHALAAFGSILGTFSTGYILVQYFGTQAIIIGTGVMLGLLALVFLWQAWRSIGSLLLLGLFISGITASRDGFTRFCDRETNYFCIRVVDMSDEVTYGTLRGMVLDHLMHGINHREYPTLLMSPYVHLMDELIQSHAKRLDGRALRGFFSGGGAYTQPRAIRARFPDADLVIAELDPAVTEEAQRKMFYDASKDRVYHADGRKVLSQMVPDYFDVIVGDVFHDIAIPHHLVTREYNELVKSRLNTNGIYVLNVVDASPDPRLVKSIVKTLKSTFPNVQIWLEEWSEKHQRQTYVIAAGSAPILSDKVHSEHGLKREWQEVSHYLANSGTSFDALPVLTDDYAPVESLLSQLIFGSLAR